jgi:photosystem II stability/assembly factor-like uncharacterized protein
MLGRRVRLWLAVAVLGVLVPAAAFGLIRTGYGRWYWQNPLPQGNYLYDVQFPTATTGWAIGERGTVLKSTDGGVSWTAQQAGTGTSANRKYSAMSFVNANVGYIAGDVVMQTTNGGGQWIGRTPGSYPGCVFSDVCFVDASTGWVVARDTANDVARILKTTDGGQFWSDQALPNDPRLTADPAFTQTSADYWLTAITFADASNGWAVGVSRGTLRSGVVLKTENGGASWTGAALSSNQPARLGIWEKFADVACVRGDAARVWICGSDGLLYRTETGGGDSRASAAAWTEHGQNAFGALTHLSFANSTTGWVVGGQSDVGVVLRTTNGGTFWEPQVAVTRRPLNSVFARDANTAWAVGEDGAIIYTKNGGSPWRTSSDEKKRPSLRAVDFRNVDRGWAVGEDGTILSTTSRGRVWNLQASTLEPLSGSAGTLRAALNGVCFVDDTYGWIVGDLGTYDTSPVNRWTILKTTDGGAHWVQQLRGPSGYVHLYDVKFVDRLNGWAVGDGGTILRTTDGGDNWFEEPSGVTEPLRAIDMRSSVNGWIVGEAGTILRNINGTWSQVTPPAQVGGAALEDVAFVDARNGWIVGDNATIMRTTNGGTDWSVENPGISWPAAPYLTSVTFADPYNGWIGGYIPSAGGIATGWTVIRTGDGGSGWVEEDPGAGYGKNLMALDAVDSGHAWGVGSWGAIMSNFDIDVVPPAPPSRFTATGGRYSVYLTWVNPVLDFTSTRIWRSSTGYAPSALGGVGQTSVYSGTGTSLNNTGLANGKRYYYTAFARDASGNWSAAAKATAATKDVVSPGPVTGLRVVAGASAGASIVSWTNPADGDFAGVRVLRKEGAASGSPSDGTVVFNGKAKTCSDSGLLAGRTYYYTVYARDGVPNWSVRAYATFTVPVPARGFTRIAGPDRYATAVQVSKRFSSGVAGCVVSFGGNFPDALAAGPLARAYGGPVLLTQTGSVPYVVLSELSRLAPKRVFVTGSTKVVSDAVLAQLRALPSGPVVTRVAGPDRFATAAAIADRVKAKRGSVSKVVVVTGADFPDALAIAPLASAKGWPILLTRATALPSPTVACLLRLGAPAALVVGTKTDVSDVVKASLPGATRIDSVYPAVTSALVLDYAKTIGVTPAHVGLAVSTKYPDGLTAGPYLARDGGLLLLTDTSTLPDSLRVRLTLNKATVRRVDIFGSTLAVSDAVVQAVRLALQ